MPQITSHFEKLSFSIGGSAPKGWKESTGFSDVERYADSLTFFLNQIF